MTMTQLHPSQPDNTLLEVQPHPNNARLQVVTLSQALLNQFQQLSARWDLQAIEYKPFLRFAVADALDLASGRQLKPLLRNIIDDRAHGAFLLQADTQTQANWRNDDAQRDDFVKLSTAVSHLIGLPNFDAMYGKYYARFTVKNADNSDSYLRQAHRRMELHNDGTYVKERTDFVLMMKMQEQNMQGGDSLLLHLDDWQELARFYHHPLASHPMIWGAPPSKNTGYDIEHAVFFEQDDNGLPHMLFIDQFAKPKNLAEGLYLYEMGESLERDNHCFNVRVPVGAMLVVHNHRWLHGRDKFIPHPELSRELLRLRGCFSR
ncbi:carbon starvation induced protein CsiD [Vibrio sp. V38_P2S17PM301]|nr:carbon starvation induced protein CsiD [Vibrio sp. V36_P2S2PM302]NAX25596.1 carbon starvation induced protein CsiD [Vibrio sp. V38_P2S17PM301]NAX30432.1 carbon starvation induced protein CsiD [Vibrio sp. V37_P2S8PM304]